MPDGVAAGEAFEIRLQNLPALPDAPTFDAELEAARKATAVRCFDTQVASSLSFLWQR